MRWQWKRHEPSSSEGGGVCGGRGTSDCRTGIVGSSQEAVPVWHGLWEKEFQWEKEEPAAGVQWEKDKDMAKSSFFLT